MSRTRGVFCGIAGLVGALATPAGWAAPFTPGNLVVAQVGDGSSALQARKAALAGQPVDQPEGPGPGSNCCFAHAGVGCDDAACQAIVCGADSFCCNTSWDSICAGEAQAMCGALCGGGGGPPANDNCADRIAVGNGSTPFSTVGATTDGPSLCGALGNDIWYNYTAPGTGSLTVTTCGSTYDTAIAVYDGCTCPPGTNLACNDDSCGLQSSVTLAVTSGMCYLIQVGGFASSTGSGTLNIMGPAGPPPSIASSNPPNGLLDSLQPNPAPCAMCTLSQGVGAAGTPVEGTVQYAPIRVTFTSAPTTTPSTCNTTLCCTGGSCPTITRITMVNSTTFDVSLSGAIPPLQCSTLEFSGGQFVQWISHPANINGDGFSNTQDLLAIVQALNNGTANLPANLHQYDVNRSGATNTQDLLREVQLLNGTQTLQVYNGSTHAACPPATACQPLSVPCPVSNYAPGTISTPPAVPTGCPNPGGSSCPCTACRGDDNVSGSVHPFSGEVVYRSGDLAIDGRCLDFGWSRSYGSITGPDSAQGSGWDSSYNLRVVPQGSGFAVMDGDTRHDVYSTPPGGGPMTSPQFFRVLTQNPDGTFTLTFPDSGRWRFHTLDGSPAAGKAISSVDRDGNAITFDYDASGR
ncbi:MAG TPA: DUF6531 domain-containing protein, partial [Phycisphaerae bacterium]